MKYVVSWQPRSNMTEEMQARSLQVFGKWSPAEGANFLQFLGRIDGPGGFAVVETDDPALLARGHRHFQHVLRYDRLPGSRCPGGGTDRR